MKKLLHICWEFKPFIQGGLGVAAEGLCDALSAYSEVGVVIPELGNGDEWADEMYQLFPLDVCESRHLSLSYVTYCEELHDSLAQDVDRFTRLVAEENFSGYDVIHAHDWMTMDAARAVQSMHSSCSGSSSVPIVLHVHSTHVDRVGAHARGSVFEREKQAMLDADKIVTVSEVAKETIVKYYEIPSQRVAVVYNGIKNEGGWASRCRAELDPPTVLYVARLESQKSPMFAVEVICAVLKKVDGARAMIVGGGSFLERVREVIKFKKMGSRVEVLGPIPHADMQMVYQSSDVLLLPSIAEPFGLVALEAAQSELAVVVSDRCGVKEVLSNSPRLPLNTVDSFDAWVAATVELLSDEVLRSQQVIGQRVLLSKITWDDAAKNLLKVLEL